MPFNDRTTVKMTFDKTFDKTMNFSIFSQFNAFHIHVDVNCEDNECGKCHTTKINLLSQFMSIS